MNSTKKNFSIFLNNFLHILTSKKFLLNLAIAFASFIVLIIFISIFLRILTHHGQQFYTPNFSGLTVEQADELADDKNIKIEIIDSVYEVDGLKGTIVDQTPPADFLIKKGRTIFLTKKATTVRQISMPDLTTGSLIQAKSEIETYGLKVGKLTYKPSPYENYILNQYIDGVKVAPKTLVDVGTVIDLDVGKTEDGSKAFVPDLSGLSKNEAAFYAAENSLNIGVLIYDNTIKTTQDSLKAKVWKQNPNKDKELDLGSEIDIWLTLNPDLLKDE